MPWATVLMRGKSMSCLIGVVQIPIRRFGDVHGLIADPLEVDRDLRGADDESQIDRHWVLKREQSEAAVVDVHLEIVDRQVAAKDVPQPFPIAEDERVHRGAHPLFGEGTDGHQPALENVKFFVDVTYVRQRRSP